MKKSVALVLFFILSFTSIPLASAQSIANCNLLCFSAGTPVQTKTGFKPIEQIRIGEFVLTKDERTGKTGYNTVVELFQRQTDKTYQITVKGITITTTEEHPFWVPAQGWVEARHLKVGDLLQNPEGKPYPIDRIEIKKNSSTVYNFRVEGVHNYFVTELEIWTHNCGAGGIRNIPMRAPSGGGVGSSYKGTGNASSNGSKSRSTPQDTGTPNSTKIDRDANNNIMKYTTYGSDGKIQEEVRISGKDHGSIPRPNVKEPTFNTNPKTGQKFQNGYKVRPAYPNEIPKSYPY
ncbi:polymorphic toxin type 24 domain-containing protein [Paenibacillus melissococcoides]|uniref:Polymorphic toxin type 24 domain-containing protein n=1 Tax=Paenibacillus melissococcoides TaxID=2912268 RepID=A0ABM9FZW0_9BACL|nr:polymorphic toxin-type HINT domain-containing protein [Paenibacillus melissococcoides]CAH8244839.1 polymorphic toxin type 24 domain-containing protein [Paenibacillus melissococcoides]CAH8709129.1 polymorphic toxin type 24 domain-containing protein [Paenibacillus melissococcoides]CAH8709885.1 polymorphic toxin type 24 domain-containing protein [Paenibacillus melissococcoides]